MFEDRLMRKELAAIGYDRLRKYIYRAWWSTASVEHFLYFEGDSHQFFTDVVSSTGKRAEKLPSARVRRQLR
jgi:hypothetical protein